MCRLDQDRFFRNIDLVLQLVLGLSKTIIRDQTLRRQTMFYVVLVALVMLFSGSTFLAIDPREHPLAFLIFWAACGWLTVLAVLLAIFDLILIRAAAKAARRELEQTFLRRTQPDEHDDDGPYRK